MAVEQVVSPGAYTSKVMVPVNRPKPPPRWAMSVMFPPTVTGPEAVVVRVGVALMTVELSPGSLQAVLTALFFASPE
jgi:hypothetical protein